MRLLGTRIDGRGGRPTGLDGALPDSLSPHRANDLLAGLEPLAFERLEPWLDRVDLHRGRDLSDLEGAGRHAWFPHDAVISMTAVMSDGVAVEMVSIGREGCVGGSAALGGGSPHGQALVRTAGAASRISFDKLRAAALDTPALRQSLLLYAEALTAQAMQTAACNAVHPVAARLCRWLLTALDRQGSSTVAATQEQLAEALGVQRSTVTVVSGELQARGLFTARRGSLSVPDRQALEAAACECYRQIGDRFERVGRATRRPG